MHFCSDELDRLICEDMPYFDLTTTLLDINSDGVIEFSSRNEMFLSGNELVKLLAKRVGLEVLFAKDDGQNIEKDVSFFKAEGKGKDVLILWKVAQNIYEYACGVATYANQMVKIAKKINPSMEILTTRKIVPFTKKIALKAIMDGGAYPHRITTSETILVFENYINLYGGWDKFINEFKRLKSKSVEKKWIVEAKDKKSAQRFIDIGVDVLQLDKVDAKTTKDIVKIAHNNGVKVISAGGINVGNIEEYAKSMTDAVVTTSPYYADSADIKVTIKKA